MDDLATWLRAQLDEDEASVHEIPEAERIWTLEASATVGAAGESFYALDQRWARHIVRHDPARMLAEVAAKRRILDDCMEYDEVPAVTDGLSVRVLMLLALPYADQPGYREEWRL